MLSKWAVRIGLAIVFLWFGANKFLRHDFWLLQMPASLANFSALVFILGIVEIIIGFLLISRWYRLGAFGAAGLLVAIIGAVGLNNDVGIRDTGLLFAAISLLLPGDKLTTRGLTNILRGRH